MKRKREGDSKRPARVASTLRDAIQEVIARGLSDPRARGLISITEVNVTPDLKHAEVLVSILPDKHQDLTLHALKHAARHIRREAGELMALASLPELHFKADVRLKQQAEVYQALAKAREERESRGETLADAPNDGDAPAGSDER